MDLGGDQMVLAEINIPPGRPGHLGLVPDDVVRVHNLLVLLNDLVGRDVVAAHVLPIGAGGQRLGVAVGGGADPLIAAQEVVRDAHGLYRETDDAVSVVGRRRRVGLVVVDVDVHVIVHVGVLGIAGTGVDEADRKSAGVVLLLLSGFGQTDGGRRDVVDDPVVVISVPDVHPEIPCLDLAELDLTKNLAVRLLLHVDGVGRILDLVTREEFAEIFRRHSGTALGNAEGEAVVVLGKLGVDGRHGVDLHGHLVALLERQGLDAGHIEGISGGEEEKGCRQQQSEVRHGGGHIYSLLDFLVVVCRLEPKPAQDVSE